jgi:hypothetical protein
MSSTWKLASGEVVQNTCVHKKYWKLVEEKLATKRARGARMLIIPVPINDQVASWVVRTPNRHSVFYAAVHRSADQLSRFVTNSAPAYGPGCLTLTLKWRRHLGGYIIKSFVDAPLIEPEPWENVDRKKSLEWWKDRAYVYDLANPHLKTSRIWQRGLLICPICCYSKSRETAKKLADTLICYECFDRFRRQGDIVRTEVRGWGKLLIPVLVQD